MRMQPNADGSWSKVGRKHYRHETGAQIAYDHNRWVWVIDAADLGCHGESYGTLWAAQARVDFFSHKA